MFWEDEEAAAEEEEERAYQSLPPLFNYLDAKGMRKKSKSPCT